MVSIRGRLVTAALALTCLLAVSGCEPKLVTLKLPSYFSSGVDEIWFWRRDERSGGYVRSGHMKLEGLVGPSGARVLQYKMIAPAGNQGYKISSPVALVEGSALTVQLTYMRWAEPGWFRVSARNRGGESPLSTREVYL